MVINKKIVISCSNAGSLINFRGRLIEILLKNNIVHVIAPVIEDDIKKKLLDLGVNVHETSLNRNSISLYSDLKYITQLFRIIRRVKPDMFFAYTFKPIVFGSMVATLCKVDNIIGMLTGLGYSFTDSSNKFASLIVQQTLKFSLRFNKNLKIIFQNKDDYQELIDKRIISLRSKAFVVNGSGVDLSHYSYSAPDILKINFIMMSRLIKSKGINEYYQAATVIKKKYPHVKFNLAGGYQKGSTDSIDDELFSKIKANDVIEYHGWVADIRGLIKESTTVVLPSFYREGVPRSLLEGLAMGRPIITTDMIGCKETICNLPGKENGFTVPVQDVSSLISKMEYLINNPQEMIILGKNGRLLAEEKFDVEKVNQRMIEIFESH